MGAQENRSFEYPQHMFSLRNKKMYDKYQNDHTSVEIDQEIFSTVITLLPLIQEGLVSVTSESMCMKYWLTAYSSLPEKV